MSDRIRVLPNNHGTNPGLGTVRAHLTNDLRDAVVFERLSLSKGGLSSIASKESVTSRALRKAIDWADRAKTAASMLSPTFRRANTVSLASVRIVLG